MAARSEVLAEKPIISVGIGTLGRCQLAAIARAFDNRLNAPGVEPVEFGADRLTRLAERQRPGAGIIARTSSAPLKDCRDPCHSTEPAQSPHAIFHLLEPAGVEPVAYLKRTRPKPIYDHRAHGFASPRGAGVAHPPHPFTEVRSSHAAAGTAALRYGLATACAAAAAAGAAVDAAAACDFAAPGDVVADAAVAMGATWAAAGAACALCGRKS